MIKGFGAFAFCIFLALCSLIGDFGPGFAIWFLSLILVAAGASAYALFLYPHSFEGHGLKKLLAFEQVNPHALAKSMEEAANVVRKDGLLAAEALRKDLSDPWMKYALKKMLDGYEKSIILHAIRNEHLRYHEQFLTLEKYKEKVSAAIPLVGLAGSLWHVMYFLGHDQPNLIAASFIPFLVSLLAQFLFSALAQQKIDHLTDQSRLYYAVVENGIAGIQEGLNAEVLSDQLRVRLGEKWEA